MSGRIGPRGFLAEIENNYDPPIPFAGTPWLARAMAVAQSESLRLRYLASMLWRYSQVAEFQQGRSLIESVQDQFQTPEAKQQLAQMLKQLEQDAAKFEQKRAEQRKQEELSVRQGHLRLLQHRLAEAKQQNRPPQEIRALEQAVEQATKEAGEK